MLLFAGERDAMDGAAGSSRNEDVAPGKAGTAHFSGDGGPAGRTTKLSQSLSSAPRVPLHTLMSSDGVG